MCIFIKHITCVGLRTNQAEKMRLSIWHMWRFEAKVAIVKRANETGGLQKAAAAGPEFPALGNWRHFVKNLSRPVKLSAAHPPLYEAKHVRLSGQLTIRCQRATAAPKRWQEEKFANIVVTLGLHQSIFRCGGLVVRLWQFEGLALTYSGSTFEVEVESGSKLECFKPAQWRPGDRARSGGCQSGLKIMFKVTIRWWRGRLTGGGKILFQTNQFSREIPIWSEISIQWPFKVFYFYVHLMHLSKLRLISQKMLDGP